jgi:hypothetical protein
MIQQLQLRLMIEAAYGSKANINASRHKTTVDLEISTEMK